MEIRKNWNLSSASPLLKASSAISGFMSEMVGWEKSFIEENNNKSYFVYLKMQT
jgi:hypothetical protein